MTPERSRKAIAIFRDVVELPPDDRLAGIEAACGSDAELRDDVQSLIANDAPEFLQQNPAVPTFGLRGLIDADASLHCQPPSKIGRYRIIERLKEGGMGVVYRAQQDNPKREVAIKVIRPGRHSTDAARRFAREAASLARLRHPGIAQIYEAGTVAVSEGEQPYLVMEFVRGEPLVSFANARQLSVSARLELIAKVCDAVQHAHEAGVIHRDLKPDNILVEDTSAGPQPRILDFGVSKLLDAEAAQATVATAPGAVVGTLSYMAPEQVVGEAGTRSDVYALGVILYELLCDELPIDVGADPLGKALRRIQDELPVPISRRRPQYRGDVETIIAKALAKDAVRRYASADALAIDLRRYLGHEPILARNPSAAYVLGRFARRHRGLVSGLALAAIAVIGATIYSAAESIRARDAERKARESEQRAVRLAQVIAEDALPALSDQAGTLLQRQALSDEIHAAAQAMLEHAPGDPAVLSIHAYSLRYRSRIARDAGRLRDALELRQNSLAARERALAALPEDPKLRAAQSIDIVLVGDIHRELGDRHAARTCYERALGLHERLLQQDPSAKHLEYAAWSQHRLAHLAREDGRLPEAASRADHFLQLSQRLLERDTDDRTALDGLREAYALLGTLHGNRGDHREAAAYHERASEIGRRLVNAYPGNHVYIAGYLSNLNNAYCHSASARVPLAARRHFVEDALPLAERLYQADPTDPTAVNHLVGLLDLNTGILDADGDMQRAQANMDRALRLAEMFRGDDGTRRPGYHAYLHAADLYQRVGRTDDARAAWLCAFEMTQRAVERPSPQPQEHFEFAQMLIQCPWPEWRDPALASEHAEQGLAATDGSLRDYWRLLAECYLECGQCDEAVSCLRVYAALLPLEEDKQRQWAWSQIDDLDPHVGAP